MTESACHFRTIFEKKDLLISAVFFFAQVPTETKLVLYEADNEQWLDMINELLTKFVRQRIK